MIIRGGFLPIKKGDDMKKIVEIYDRIANWLSSWGSDKWLHFVAGVVASFVFAKILMLTTMDARMTACAMSGIGAAAFVGLVKEVCDTFRGGAFDPKDLLFTLSGGALGALLYLM